MYSLAVRSMRRRRGARPSGPDFVLLRDAAARRRRAPRGRLFSQRGTSTRHAFLAALAAEAALLVAAEADGRVEIVGGVDPHHAGLDLRRDVEREVDVLVQIVAARP
jgi:hypothetical protein